MLPSLTSRTRGKADPGAQRVFLSPPDGGDPSSRRRRAASGSLTTVGVDLSATDARTACAAIEWGGGEALVCEPAVGLGREELITHLARGAWIGIDAPFGWPQSMVAAIRAYTGEEPWPEPEKTDFRLRRSDRHVHEAVLDASGETLWPMSVSADALGLTAWRTAQLREDGFRSSGRRFDRAGGDKVLEVHPRAALALWGLPHKGYKTNWRNSDGEAAVSETRVAILAGIESRAPWLRWKGAAREACLECDDALDALIAALIARAGALGLTTPPPAEDLEAARAEGWAHLPTADCLPGLAGDR